VSFVSLWFLPRARQQDCILEYILPTKPKRAAVDEKQLTPEIVDAPRSKETGILRSLSLR
jgi:hypothetical protein